jgi:hypothetical protein
MLMVSGVGRVVEIAPEEQHETFRRFGLLGRDENDADRTDEKGPFFAPQDTQEHALVRRDATAYIAFWKKESSLQDGERR